jgi:inhibitor of cysteine peptidase
VELPTRSNVVPKRDCSWTSFAGVALAAWMYGVPSVRAQDSAVTLPENQNGGSAQISKNQKLHIRLPVQGGTGFSWQLTRTPSAPVRLLSSSTQPAGRGNVPGGPATELFVFEPTGAGAGDIELGYRRPWEKDVAPARTFAVHVVVGE